MFTIFKKKNNHHYDNSSYGSEEPNTEEILVDPTELSSIDEVYKHSEVLDPKGINHSVGSNTCTPQHLCVPIVNVPTETRELVESFEETNTDVNNPNNIDKAILDEVNTIAKDILVIPDAKLTTSDTL